MDLLSPQQLKNLTNEHEDFCVSIIMPMEKTITADIKNKTRFIDLIHAAENKFGKTKLNKESIRKHLKRAYEFAEDDSNWHKGIDGLAVYLSENNIKSYWLPFVPKESVNISHYFHLLPLITGFYNNPTYYVLVVDEGLIQLYKGNLYTFSEIDIKELYKSEKDYMKRRFDLEESQIWRVEARGGRAKRHENVIYHGHGNMKDEQKIRAKRFFQITEPLMTKVMEDAGKGPLILSGHDFLISIYKNINSYNQTLNQHIEINAGPIKPEFLHNEGNKVIVEYQKKIFNDEVKKFSDNINTEFTSGWPEEIIKAGQKGSMDSLFYNKDIEAFGFIEMVETDTHVIVTNNNDDESLTNLAITYGLKNDAKLFPLKEKEMPLKVPFCARFSY